MERRIKGGKQDGKEGKTGRKKTRWGRKTLVELLSDAGGPEEKIWRKDRKVAVRKEDDGEGTTDVGGRRKGVRNDSGWNEERFD